MTWVSKDSGGDPGPPVKLTTVFDPVEGEMIVAKLRSAGIESFLRHEALSVVYGLTFDGAGQQEVMVRAEDLEEALVALEESPLPESDAFTEDEED